MSKPRKKFPIILALLFLIAIAGSGNKGTDQQTEVSTTTTAAPSATNAEAVSPTPDIESQVDLLPRQLLPEGYTGAECWLLYESEYTEYSANPKIIEVYAAVDPTDADWREQTKIVITMLSKEFKTYDDVMFKVFCSMNNKTASGQPSYNNLIALWESKPPVVIGDRSPRIIWYPKNTSTVNAQETEIWSP